MFTKRTLIASILGAATGAIIALSAGASDITADGSPWDDPNPIVQADGSPWDDPKPVLSLS